MLFVEVIYLCLKTNHNSVTALLPDATKDHVPSRGKNTTEGRIGFSEARERSFGW